METSKIVENRFQIKPCLRKEDLMVKSSLFTVALLALTVGTAGAQQYPIMETIAGNIIAKYQNSSCEQL